LAARAKDRKMGGPRASEKVSMAPDENKYVTRAGVKLEHALETFGLDVTGRVCADLGSHQGGFVDCLLAHGAAKV